MVVAAVRSVGSARCLRTPQELDDFEQELVDQFALALAGSGVTDGLVAQDRSTVFQFLQFLGRPVWTTQTADADRFLVSQRKRGLARATVYRKATRLAVFFDFLIARYQGDINAVTGYVVEQPIDEFNRPASTDRGILRVPPADDEVEALFSAWSDALPEVRKFLPAARDYFAASLWRRIGLRISESTLLDMRDWRPDLREHGKLHVRFGKGSNGHGPKTRLVPAINSVDALIEWWLTDVRHQFGDDWTDPDAPLLPSERRDRDTSRCVRAGANTVRAGFADAVQQWLPSWQGRLTPHVLRHYCASSLYARGMDLKAIQELAGHEWLSTTTRYIHVHDQHVEHAWASANNRVAARLAYREV